MRSLAIITVANCFCYLPFSGMQSLLKRHRGCNDAITVRPIIPQLSIPGSLNVSLIPVCIANEKRKVNVNFNFSSFIYRCQ